MTTTPVNATETEAPGADDDGNDVDEDDGAESGGWVEYDVDNRTVDLTELRGANASLIDEFDVPNGTYNKVFVHVGEVNATLTNGESVRVKLPSEKLQLNKRFTVENGTDVEFVFDIAVHKAGKSGKYILKPVISESGTDVPIEKVGRGSDEGEPDESESGLDAMFVGNVTQGENATIEVTREGEPVANATVIVNDGPIGVTDTSGRITFTVPDGEELEVTIRTGDSEAELEREFESEGNAPEETPTPAAGA